MTQGPWFMLDARGFDWVNLTDSPEPLYKELAEGCAVESNLAAAAAATPATATASATATTAATTTRQGWRLSRA